MLPRQCTFRFCPGGVKFLEKALFQSKCKFVRDRRREQANLIFKDIQKTSSDRLELLLGVQEAAIVATDADNFRLTLSVDIVS